MATKRGNTKKERNTKFQLINKTKITTIKKEEKKTTAKITQLTSILIVGKKKVIQIRQGGFLLGYKRKY